MKIEFVKYEGISGYARVMYNDVKDSDTNRIEVAYSGKDIKALLEYLFSLEERIDKAIEYIETWCYDEYSIAIKIDDIFCSSEPEAIDKLLDILKGEENEGI